MFRSNIILTPRKRIGKTVIAQEMLDCGYAARLSYDYETAYILLDGVPLQPNRESFLFGLHYRVEVPEKEFMAATYHLATMNTTPPANLIGDAEAYLASWLEEAGRKCVTTLEVLRDCFRGKPMALLQKMTQNRIARMLSGLGWIPKRTNKGRFWEKLEEEKMCHQHQETPEPIQNKASDFPEQVTDFLVEKCVTAHLTEEALQKEVVENPVPNYTVVDMSYLDDLMQPSLWGYVVEKEDNKEECVTEPQEPPTPSTEQIVEGDTSTENSKEENVSPAPVEEEENIDPDYWMLPENKPRFYKMPGEFRVRVWDESDRRDAEKKALETAKKKYLAKALPVEEELVDEDEEEEELDKPRIPGNNKTVYDPFYGQRFCVEGGEDY